MRREGFEMTVSRPRVIEKSVNGEILEPYEQLTLDLPQIYVGAATTRLSKRQGRMVDMTNKGTGRVRMVFRVPSRGLIGFRGDFLGETRGEAVINTNFGGFAPRCGDVPRRANGVVLSRVSSSNHILSPLKRASAEFVRTPPHTPHLRSNLPEHLSHGVFESFQAFRREYP